MQPMSVASWFYAIPVAMEQWAAQHRAFVVEAYFKNGDSAVTTHDYFADTLTFLVMTVSSVVTQ